MTVPFRDNNLSSKKNLYLTCCAIKKIDYSVFRDRGSLMAAGPRSCYRAALATIEMCFASFQLPSPSLGTAPKEARPQELTIHNFPIFQ